MKRLPSRRIFGSTGASALLIPKKTTWSHTKRTSSDHRYISHRANLLISDDYKMPKLRGIIVPVEDSDSKQRYASDELDVYAKWTY